MSRNNMEVQDNDNEEHAVKCGEAREEFKEHREIFTIIHNIPISCGKQERAYEKFLYIIDQYQEQPFLLDPYLEKMVNVLLDLARNSKYPQPVMHMAFKFLYLITKTRGYKVIVRLMPHEVSDVEVVLGMLNQQDKADHATWETRYCLLLWLSIVCMIPFDMARLDSNIRTQTGEVKKPVMERIIEVGQTYLDVFDKSRDAAAYMLSRFMTRPDVQKAIPEFLDWALQYINKSSGMMAMSGVLTSLALLFKHGKREDLVGYAPQVLKIVFDCGLLTDTLHRKLGIKLVQRLALTFLKAKVATWRYQRGSRSLVDNIAPQQLTGQQSDDQKAIEDEEEEYDIPDEIEEIIETLLQGLKDNHTIVRWSAAKGIGRITGRLPQELADEVVGSLMELFTITETDGAWHGGCLALAELGRRGLLLPGRLPDVVPVIVRALSYDEKKGNFSVGAHVRDAACYVCWAFARAYDPVDLKPYVNQIASSLVIVSIFDREVNVRRAAAAAFQENVGRQGQFPYGIDILTTCDYFAVGNRNSCYLKLSVFVSQFEEYTQPLIDHLAKIKVNHWDIAMRELASQGLHKLTEKDPQYIVSAILPDVLEACTSIDLIERHGSIIAVAEIIHALAELKTNDKRCIEELLGKKSSDLLRDITYKLESSGMFRGLSGELMRKAVCCLVEKLSLARMPYHGDPIIETWQKLLDDCLHHLEPEIQNAAVAAIPAFFTEYYRCDDGSAKRDIQDDVTSKYLKELRSNAENIRMGYALALGALPQFFLQNKLQDIFEGLTEASKISDNVKWAEARRDAVKAITSICKTVGLKKDGDKNSCICTENVDMVYNTLFLALKDYTLDSRGDVGAVVREASMSGLFTLTSMLARIDQSMISDTISKQVFCNLVQQASEKIDRTRAHAGEIFAQLLYHDPEIPHIPHREELIRLFPKNEVDKMSWSVPANTFPKFVELLSLPSYSYNILLGLTVSVGGLTESLVRHSSESLQFYLRKLGEDSPEMLMFSKMVLEVFKDHQKQDRVTVPLFKMIDQLLANGSFSYYVDHNEEDWPSELLSLVKFEIKKVGDPQKLLASVDVLCGLLQFPGNVRRDVLSSLMVFLCHRFPIVRKTTSAKLYEAVVTYDGVLDDDNMEGVMNLLSETQWDLSLTEVKPVRNRLCELLGVPKPVSLKAVKEKVMVENKS